jgi:hypothetical protein
MGRSLQGTHHTELLGGCRRRCPRHRLAPAGHPYGTPSSATGLAASRIIRRADRLLNRSEWWLTSRFVISWCPLLSPRFRRVAAPRPTPRLCAALSDYAAFPIPTRTFVRYAGPAGTWHDLDVSRPIAAPLERCAELLGVDLATLRQLAAEVEPYLRADGTRIWSLMQLERQFRPEAYRLRCGGYLDRRRTPATDA